MNMDFVSRRSQKVHLEVALTRPIKLELIVSVFVGDTVYKTDSALCWFLLLLMQSQTGGHTD